MNPSLDVGTRRDPLGISDWRSVAHRIVIYESSPRSFSVGSKIGDHHHELRRSASRLDARECGADAQEAERKKLALRLPVRRG
jgi:hypothetical protein